MPHDNAATSHSSSNLQRLQAAKHSLRAGHEEIRLASFIWPPQMPGDFGLPLLLLLRLRAWDYEGFVVNVRVDLVFPPTSGILGPVLRHLIAHRFFAAGSGDSGPGWSFPDLEVLPQAAGHSPDRASSLPLAPQVLAAKLLRVICKASAKNT